MAWPRFAGSPPTTTHGEKPVSRAADINDPNQLPGVGFFPVTIDEQARRVSTGLAYLGEDVRARHNLVVRTQSEVARIPIEDGRTRGVVLAGAEEILADEVVVTAWSTTSRTSGPPMPRSCR